MKVIIPQSIMSIQTMKLLDVSKQIAFSYNLKSVVVKDELIDWDVQIWVFSISD